MDPAPPYDVDEFLAALQGKNDHDLLVTLNLQMRETLGRLEKGDKRMDELDTRLGCIELQHKQETAVVSFLDTLAGRVCTCLGIVSVSLALLMVYVIPPALVLWRSVH